jgi:short subunit dehydrogenase-like uncharacterized protein
MEPAPVAVYGASGYCGKLIARELQELGHKVILAGRNEAALRAVAATLPVATECRSVTLDDEPGLQRLCAGVGAVVNAAGQFSTTTKPLVRAAVAGRAHYLDISGEQRPIRWTIEQHASAAAAGVALLPCTAFQPTLCDLLVALAAADLPDVTEAEVAYSIRGWRPSGGTVRARLETMADPILLQYDDGFVDLKRTPPTRIFDFPAPIGPRRVMRYPAADALTLPRHLSARRVSTYMTTSTLAPPHLERFVPMMTHWVGRALRSRARQSVERVVVARWRGSHQRLQDDPTTFDIAVRLSGPGGVRTAVVSGRGIFDICGPLTARIASRVLDPAFDRAGFVAAPEVVDAGDFLGALVSYGVSYRLGSIDEPQLRAASAPAISSANSGNDHTMLHG